MYGSSFHDTVRVVPYQEEWAQRFQTIKERITELLMKANIECDVWHVGGTAIPGMCGKSIVDVLVTVDSEDMEIVRMRLQGNLTVLESVAGPDVTFSLMEIRSTTPCTSI